MSTTTHPWLKGGTHSSAELPTIADWLAKSNILGGLLDVGCGNGGLLRLLSRKQFSPLVGVDIEKGHCLAAIRTAPEAEIICADFFQGKPVAYFFKVICCINVLHNDWRHKHRVGAPKTAKPEPNYLDRFFQVAGECLAPNGIIIADWRGDVSEAETYPVAAAAEQAGFALKDRFAMDMPTFIFEQKCRLASTRTEVIEP